MTKNPGAHPTPSPVAEICLYGTGSIGAGYLARTAGGRMFGTGEPVAARSFTDAMWLAVIDLHAAGVTRGDVLVFDPTGLRVARMSVSLPVYFGELSWAPAPVYVITADAIAAAAGLDLVDPEDLPTDGSDAL
jgi:hypothetical protein